MSVHALLVPPTVPAKHQPIPVDWRYHTDKTMAFIHKAEMEKMTGDRCSVKVIGHYLYKIVRYDPTHKKV